MSGRFLDNTCDQLDHFIKTILIKWFIYDDNYWICEFFPGSGSDIGKWQRANIAHLTAIDTNPDILIKIIERCQHKKFKTLPLTLHVDINNIKLEWNNIPTIYPPLQTNTSELSILSETLIPSNHINKYNIVSCFAGLDKSFKNENSARTIIYNASKILKDNGIFFGIIPDSSVLFTKANKPGIDKKGIIDGGDFEILLPFQCNNNIQQIFENNYQQYPFIFRNKDNIHKEHELYLVHSPSFIRLCAENGLLLIEMKNLAGFYEENKKIYKSTLQKILGTMSVKSKHILRLGLFTTFIFKKTTVSLYNKQ